MPHEEMGGNSGPRPAVIVQDLPAVKGCIVLPMTSKLERMAFPMTVKVEPSIINRLNGPSVVLVFQVRHIRRDALVHRLGPLSEDDRTRVRDMLGDMLGFEV